MWETPSNKCIQRFDIFFGKNNYETLNTPIPMDDPLDGKIKNIIKKD